MGADVIKVETPNGGDLARQLGADAELNAQHMGTSFLAQNANKRSVVVDLKSAQGRETFLALVRASDVVLENFRRHGSPGSGARDAAADQARPGLLRDIGFRP